VELRSISESHSDLLSALQLQDDVWEFIGTLPEPGPEHSNHLFAVVEGQANLGFAGLVKSQAAGGEDFELLVAMRSEAQQHGLAKHACQLVLSWAFNTAKLERVIASIDNDNEAARAIAGKLGMTQLGPTGPTRTVYVKYRDEGSLTSA